MATQINTTNLPSQPLPTVALVLGPPDKPADGRCYTLRLNGYEVLVDARDKGKPGDIVVLWPKKKGPVVTRRLARVAPYPGDADRPDPRADRYYFADLAEGYTFNVALNKVAAIHKVVGDLN